MKDAPAGIVCKKCSGTASVVVKTVRGPGRIDRYRQCAGCDNVFLTREIYEATPKPHRDRRPPRARAS